MEIEGAKSAVNSCELPTGVVHKDEVLTNIIFREMSGYEEDIMANKKMSVSKKLTNVISNCINKFGSVEDRATINQLTEKLLITDRLFMLLQLRMASVDEIVRFESACPSCGKMDKKVFNLNEIKISGVPKATDVYKVITLPKSGKKIRIKAADSKAEEAIERATNEKNAVSLALFTRIDLLDDKPPVLVDIMQLSTSDRSFLRKSIDDLEGKIDDEFKAICPDCGHEYTGSVPIAGVDFFFP